MAPARGAAPNSHFPACTIPGLPWQHQEHQPSTQLTSPGAPKPVSRPQDRPRPGVLFARGRTPLTPGTRASSDTPRHPACTQVHLPLMLNPLPLHPLEAETLYPWYGLLLLAPSGLAVTCLTPFSSSLSFHPVCDRGYKRSDRKEVRGQSSVPSLWRDA